MRVVAAPYVMLGAPPDSGEHSPVPPHGSIGRGFALRHTGNWIANGAIALDGDHVVAVGPAAEIEARHGQAELLDAVLLPALVNSHLHLELSHLAGQVPGGEGLAPWIEKLVAARKRIAGAEEAMAPAASALVRAGVAAVGDVTNTLGSLRHLAREGLVGTLFHEVFGYGSERALAATEAAAQVRRRAGPPPPGLRIVTSPHSVYSTNPRLVAQLLLAGPASIHLAEDPAERDFCTRMQGPLADLSRRVGATDPRPLRRSAIALVAPYLQAQSLVVHAVDLDARDLIDLARSGATVVLCPRSNQFIGKRIPDLPRLLGAGIPLAIGTDSLASSPSLSPLAELATLHRAFVKVPPVRLLALAWNGASVGAPAVGRLSPGSAPGILAAPLDGARPPDPFAWLLNFGAEERPFVWIAPHRPEVPAA